MPRPFSREAVLNRLTRMLWDEIRHIREELGSCDPRDRDRLRRELRNSSLALAELLQQTPETGDVEDWLERIRNKVTKKLLKSARELVAKMEKSITKTEGSER